MNAKLCATVTGATTDALRQARDAATDADMVELRLDYADEVDIGGLLSDRRVPVIVTCRPTWAGGQFSGSEEERGRLLTLALTQGAEFIDVEWGSDCAALIDRHGGRRVVLSDHNFEGVPDDLEQRYRSMRATGAQVVKLAARVRRLSELIQLRDLASGSQRHECEHVVIGMGPAGLPSRLLPDHFGSAWTYGGTGTPVAPGQLDVCQMLEEFQIRRAAIGTELFGVLGSPLGHSLSPVMHNAGFAETGRNAVYIPLDAADVDDFQSFADAFDLRGASVTAPFKEAVMTGRVHTDEVGQRVGAVNTLRRAGPGWEGTNTDVAGFLDPLRSRLELNGRRVTILGAGGAARGVAVALSSVGAEVTVSARQAASAEAVASLVGGGTSAFPPAGGSWDLLVNTTPLGTYPNVNGTPVSGAELDGTLVYDLVYNPPVTRLLSDAAAAGCKVVGGLGMLVAQAERQFAWWTGQPPAPDLFRAAAERQLHRHQEKARAESATGETRRV